MEWVKKPQITCEADKAWNSVVRGGGRTSLTWYDKGQEHERPEDVKQKTWFIETGLREQIFYSGTPAFLHALQKVEYGPSSDQRLGNSLVGLHMKCRIRVRANGWAPPEVRTLEFNNLINYADWQPGTKWERQSIFAAIIQDVTGTGDVGTVSPEAVTFVSLNSDDGLRTIPRGTHSLHDKKGQWEIIAFDSWTPSRPPIRRERKTWDALNPGGLDTEWLYWDTSIHEQTTWEDEEHEFFFSVDLEQALHYGEIDTPVRDGLYLVLWGGATQHPGLMPIGEIIEGQLQFTWEEILTERQRKRALRDRLLNTQREVSTYGKQTHAEQMKEEADNGDLDNPLFPEQREEHAEMIRDQREIRRYREERDELEGLEEDRRRGQRRYRGTDIMEDGRPRSFTRIDDNEDPEVWTGGAFNGEGESDRKKKR